MRDHLERRPYLDARIDWWKVGLLALLFTLLLWGALTWVGGPWANVGF